MLASSGCELFNIAVLEFFQIFPPFYIALSLPNKEAENRLIPVKEFIRISEVLHQLWNSLPRWIVVGDNLKHFTGSHFVKGQAWFKRWIGTNLSSQIQATGNIFDTHDVPPTFDVNILNN
jgi:hypothetical protein